MKSSKVSLRRHETLRGGLLRIFKVLTDAAPSHSDKSQNDEETTHRIRTTIKRLRSLLRLIRPAVDAAFFDRENGRLRTAARLLSSARDSEVARDTVKTLPMSGQSGRQAVDAVLSGLETRIERAKAHEPDLAEVKRRLEQTRRSVRRLKVHRKEREIIEPAIKAVYRQGRKRMKTAIQTGQDGDYHRWRIRAKNLYYELQFLEPIWPKRLHRMTARLSKLQDRIGLDHDLAVLRAELKKTPDAFGGEDKVERIVSCLDRQTHKLRRAAAPLGRKIWRKKPSRFARKLTAHWCDR